VHTYTCMRAPAGERTKIPAAVMSTERAYQALLQNVHVEQLFLGIGRDCVCLASACRCMLGLMLGLCSTLCLFGLCSVVCLFAVPSEAFHLSCEAQVRRLFGVKELHCAATEQSLPALLQRAVALENSYMFVLWDDSEQVRVPSSTRLRWW
jgi:hypothetical protein